MPAHRKDNPGHAAIHNFLARNYTKSGVCEHCGREGKTHWAAKDHSNYTRHREDYMELCPKCHLAYDGNTPPRQKGTTISCEHRERLNAGRRRNAARRRELGIPDPGALASAAARAR